MPTFDSGIAWLPPATVAIPILVAALLLTVVKILPRRVIDLLTVLTAAGVLTMSAVVLAGSVNGRVVTWSANWAPVHGSSVGIVLVSDPLGAGLAVLAASLTLLAAVYSWRYMESAEGHFHSLLLLFLAGLEGFAFTGDLFDLFVFFELMGAAAYALTGMKIEDPKSLHGAVNFGIVNSLGAYVSLIGVGLLYARTGDLGLPSLGAALAHHRPDVVVIAAFVLITTGFVVKGAMAPFHFWLADAHAVAPAPVCVLFSGVMVPLGIYAAFRVYWVVFSQTIPAGDVRRCFLVFGVVTALLGAVMCLAQRNLKRLLAYSTIAHVGLFLVALSMLNEAGTAGAAIYIAGHSGVKAALFLMAGVILSRYGSLDEADLHGRGRDARVMPWLFVAGGLGLACLPPFGTALGKAISEDAGVAAGYPWMPALFVVVSALTGGAVLRAAGRIYFGLGPKPQESPGQTSGSGEERDTEPLPRVPVTMLVPIVVLLAGSLSIGLLPAAHDAFARAAAYFVDATGYRRQALAGAAATVHVAGSPNWTATGLGLGFASAVGALGVAAAGIWIQPILRRLPWLGAGRRGLGLLRALHSGHVGDYVAWLMLGVAVLAGFIGLPLR